MQADSQVCRTKPDQIQPVPNFPQVPSARQSRQGRGSCQSPGAFIAIIPEAARPPLHTDMHAAQQIWQGCSGQSPGAVLSTPRTLCPSCRELWFLKTPRMELRRHGFLRTPHCADSSWMFSNRLEGKSVEFYFSYKPPRN